MAPLVSTFTAPSAALDSSMASMWLRLQASALRPKVSPRARFLSFDRDRDIDLFAFGWATRSTVWSREGHVRLDGRRLEDGRSESDAPNQGRAIAPLTIDSHCSSTGPLRCLGLGRGNSPQFRRQHSRTHPEK